MASQRASEIKRAKRAAHVALFLPWLYIGLEWTVWPQALGANPIEATVRYFGFWALKLLILTLLMTPLAKWTKSPLPIAIRRIVGLWMYTYAILHLFAYVGADQGFDWAAIGGDIVKRTYITLGMTAFALLLPLALTSTDKSIRRLGAKRWQYVHRLIYPAIVLAGIHFFMMRKGIQREPVIYGLVILGLLAYRLPIWKRSFTLARG